MAYSVLSFGELLWDMLPSGKVLGGAPANFALRVSELGEVVRVCSRVGDDALGHVEGAAGALGIAEDDIDPVALRRVADCRHLRTVALQRILVIARRELQAPGR